MLKNLLKTDDDRVVAMIRIALGYVMFTHGAGKVLGWYGGGGIAGTFGFMNGMLHIPAPFAYLAIFTEFFASIGLMLGFFGRLSALGIIGMQLGALFLVHIHNGWSGHGGGGIEYMAMSLPMAVAVLIRGSGAWSLDRVIGK